jgi:hypothetical protein
VPGPQAVQFGAAPLPPDHAQLPSAALRTSVAPTPAKPAAQLKA